MQDDRQLESNSGGILPIIGLLVLGLISVGVVAVLLLRRPEVGPKAAVPVREELVAPAGDVEAPPDPIALRSQPTNSSADARKPPGNATEQVKANFQRYSKALLDGDGNTAWSLIDSKTGQFYAQALRDALSAPRADLNRMDYIHKVTVLRLRTEFRKPQLQALNGRDVFLYAVTNGWISKSTIQSLSTFQRVAVNGRYASAYFAAEPNTPAFFFIYEDSQWKIALWKIFETANLITKQMKQESKLPENDFLLGLIRQLSKNEVSAKIFEGPID